MIMDDHEILMRYKEAADQKRQIGILADLNDCSVWEMREKLISLGAAVDGRWYQNQNPARRRREAEDPNDKSAFGIRDAERRGEGPGARTADETAEPIAGMERKDAELADLRQAVREKTEWIDGLERKLEERNGRIADLEQRNNEIFQDRANIMRGAKGEIERLTERLRDCESYVRELESALDAGRRVDADADWADVLHLFLEPFYGVEAYAAGRILEALYFRPGETETWTAIREASGLFVQRTQRGNGGDGDAA